MHSSKTDEELSHTNITQNWHRHTGVAITLSGAEMNQNWRAS